MYYWKAVNTSTGEVAVHGQGYKYPSEAANGARQFVRRNWGMSSPTDVMIEVYDRPFSDETLQHEGSLVYSQPLSSFKVRPAGKWNEYMHKLESRG